ncbi:MAG: efflux RND transporter periplasmic adaptor subunit [Candidatus Amulumruptor caecigallinarius]|nr:efflux RND transporter periplasmic adaptor subunit [Candidatus Amulumruptor caecigallinarius]MCM1397795.1 efflux RND transporter periplasmic adaptor subunit [Candidatus Amulumruptor caecigallinarius]MCM1454843.1 efflux RND transporter periplasmic adaptor subunit [bacterium]
MNSFLSSVSSRPAHSGRWLLAVTLLGVTASCGSDSGNASRVREQVTTAEVRPVNTIANGDYDGIIKAQHTVEVSSRAEGVLRSRLFVEGAGIHRGQPLFQIDPTVYQARVSKAKANVTKAQANALKARRDLDRITPLYEANAASRLDLDNATAAFENASADLEVARADLEMAQVELADTRIKAPITGFISRSNVDEGAYVGPGSGALATMVNVDSVYVEFALTTEQYARSRAHGLCFDANCTNPAHERDYVISVTNTDGEPYPFKGRVDFAAHRAETDRVVIRAKVPNLPHVLLPGSRTRVRVEAASPRDVIAVPLDAVVHDGPRYFVYIPEGSSYALRTVNPGPILGDSIIIESGLAAGDHVVVGGLSTLISEELTPLNVTTASATPTVAP